jgi:hypothetical protein
MARRNDPKDAAADFDELLAEEPVAEEAVAGDVPEDETPAEPELTPAQKRLMAAREAAAALESAPDPVGDEDPFEGLTAEQVAELKALEDKVVRANTQKLVAAERSEPRFDNSRKGGTGEKILFHVVKDGFVAFGDVWYRGQEIEIEVGTAAYKRTFDKNGFTWLSIIDDEDAQYEKWGERRIAPGEFRPRRNEIFDDELVSLDRRRGRTVPVVSA